jgi:hypothetical protein
MMMNKRDYSIICDIERFRCLSRDDIMTLYFSHTRNPIPAVNKILRRLVDRDLLKVDRDATPYLYFPAGSKMAFNSQKINHYRAIFNVYLGICKLGGLRRFEVEPKLGAKGTVEPDVFCIWHGTPFFIEVQLSNFYNTNYMLKKLARYEQYRLNGNWRGLDWQRKDKKVFPLVWIVSEKQYTGFPNVLQTKNAQEMYDKMKRVVTQ